MARRKLGRNAWSSSIAAKVNKLITLIDHDQKENEEKGKYII
jgi:hypothetical protein